jgi:flagellar biosynthesis protein FlhB
MSKRLCSAMAWAYLRYAPDARYTRVLVKIRNALILVVCTVWVGVFLLFAVGLVISSYIHRDELRNPKKEVKHEQ